MGLHLDTTRFLKTSAIMANKVFTTFGVFVLVGYVAAAPASIEVDSDNEAKKQYYNDFISRMYDMTSDYGNSGDDFAAAASKHLYKKQYYNDFISRMFDMTSDYGTSDDDFAAYASKP